MLKITVHKTAKGQTIQLEGKIVGPWVQELKRTWQSLEPSLGAKQLQLDLRDVVFVDANGRQLLREIHQQTDACFLADSPLMQYFAEEAMQHSLKTAHEGV
jgi:anti-anti-sigma regulatory factor